MLVDLPCYDEEAIVSVPADQPLNKNKEALMRRLGKDEVGLLDLFFFELGNPCLSASRSRTLVSS